MQRSHVPIQEWCWAVDLVATLTPGLSALPWQRQLGRGSCRRAWVMLNRLCLGMVNDSRTTRPDVVEADGTLNDGPVKYLRGRGVIRGPDTSLVVWAVQIVSYRDTNGASREQAGRLRLALD